MADIKHLERLHNEARAAFDTAARAAEITKADYDRARDKYVIAMRAHHDALEAQWRQQS